MTKKFPEGVEIYLPDDYKHLKVKRLAKPQPTSEIGRVVMNFHFYNPLDKNKKHKGTFTDPVTLLVEYTSKDEERAAAKDANPELRYDSGSGWTTFTDVTLIPHGKDFGGVGIVDLPDWDPAVGWFP